MKTRNKALLMVLCAVLLVAGSVLGTLAYLTSTDSVTNTFTVGNVQIKLDEAEVGADGTALKGNDAARVKANNYKLMPGHTYDKDPTVTVIKGSESSYIKLVVVVTKSQELDAIGVDLLTTFKDYDSTTWLYKGNTEDTTENTRTYEFWYKETVSAPAADVKLDALFKTITIPGTITNTQIATVNGMTITITAHAIQADGFANANAAWAAYNN